MADENDTTIPQAAGPAADNSTGDAAEDFLKQRSEADPQAKPGEASKPDAVETPNEPPAPKTDAEIEAAYNAGDPLTRNEIDRWEEIKDTRRLAAWERQQEQEFVSNLVPNTTTKLTQALAEHFNLNLGSKDGKLLSVAVQEAMADLGGRARDVYGQPYINANAYATVKALTGLGMSKAEAEEKVFGQNAIPFTEYAQTIADYAKKNGSLKTSDITAEWVEKHAPETFKAIEDKFHEKWPERGGKGRPADGSTPARWTRDQYLSASQDERLEYMRAHPQEWAALA